MTAAGATTGPALVQVVFIEALVAVFILLRSLRTYRGRVLSVARLVVFPAAIVLLWALAEAENAISLPGSWPWWSLVDVGLVVAAAVATVPLAPRLLSVFRGSDGQWMYRYGIELISFYLAAWVVRLALSLYFDPASLEFAIGPVPAISTNAAQAMQLVQALFSVSTGLVVGRSASTYRMYHAAVRASPTEPAPLA